MLTELLHIKYAQILKTRIPVRNDSLICLYYVQMDTLIESIFVYLRTIF